MGLTILSGRNRLQIGRTRQTLPTLANEEGQSVVEYILLLGVVTIVLITTFQWLNNFGFAEKISSPLTEKYAKIYKYGHPKAKGPDEGTPEFHPALPMTNNRFFINPASQ